MAGVLAATPVRATLVGDASLSRRPMERVARAAPDDGGDGRAAAALRGLPMTIHGGDLHEIEWSSAVASAQIKSAILLAALVSGVHARVTEPVRSRDHTERMLAARGAAIRVTENSVSLAREFMVVARRTRRFPATRRPRRSSPRWRHWQTRESSASSAFA